MARETVSREEFEYLAGIVADAIGIEADYLLFRIAAWCGPAAADERRVRHVPRNTDELLERRALKRMSHEVADDLPTQ